MSARIVCSPIELVQGDITLLDTDAIVNPSNTSLVLGSGVSGSIKTRGGHTIQEEMSKIGKCAVGKAVVTSAGNLPSKYVIHTVGPRMGEGDEDKKLKNATETSLKLAEELKLSSIAFPAISTGAFGFPVKSCSIIMLTSAFDHFASKGPRSLQQIVFCLHDSDVLEEFKSTIKWLQPYHDDI
ncbi:O-acetyl-ADP-ribose deacetylase [hydrothermal vent metagenome]|uniref:O-acetyl-ADP-ribose deacetylase n=1 Tax=hydrothermal vent metagenome TaxID=652676 RepID=A0A3B1D6H6_9ZZZZ